MPIIETSGALNKRIITSEEYRNRIKLTTTLSKLASVAIRIVTKQSGKTVVDNISFENRPYLRRIYNYPVRRKLFKTGRQSGKTTTVSTLLLLYSLVYPGFKSLYVAPTQKQMRQFSYEKLGSMIRLSPWLQVFFPPYLINNVGAKQAVNESAIYLDYYRYSADKIRGYSVDLMAFDEFQDIILETIPDAEECTAASPFKYIIYSGTPKTLDNPIEYYWTRMSIQHEWAVPCDHCGHWNILGEQHIGLKGPICEKCGNRIYPNHEKATWVVMNPDENLADPIYAYRIPQLIVPTNWMDEQSWKILVGKRETYPTKKLYNEVLALSYDSGTKPLTREDVLKNCDNRIVPTPEYLKKLQEVLKGQPVFAGIDWGTGEGTSFTVITLAAYMEKKFTVFLVHRFEGPESEPEVQLEKITKLLKAYNVKYVGVDYGGGFWQNSILLKRFPGQVLIYQYVSAQGQLVKWDKKSRRFKVSRNELMAKIFNAIKRGSVFKFPSWMYFEPYAKDYLNIYSEYNESRDETVFRPVAGTSDDSFHSLIYAFLASQQVYPRSDVFSV